MLQRQTTETMQVKPLSPHQGMPPFKEPKRPLSFFEFWPGWLFYIPLKTYILYLSLRYGGLTVFTAANPLIETGGFVSDRKSDIYKLFSDRIQHYLPKTLCWNGDITLKDAQKSLNDAEISYPFIAKPDRGCRGAGVQKITTETRLKDYLKKFPDNDNIIIQEPINYEGEAGVFYIRQPNEDKGHIFSLTLKYFPHVYGDGVSTLKDLIEADPRASKLTHIYFPRHNAQLETILEKGQPYRLSFAGSHSKGCIFKDGSAYITPAMEARFDTVSKDIKEFYFGRFDVRFNDLSDLETGKEMKIIELNGVGSEATHIWDADISFIEATRVLFKQYKLAYEIGAKNKKRGFKPTTIKDLLAAIKSHKNKEFHYPSTD